MLNLGQGRRGQPLPSNTALAHSYAQYKCIFLQYQWCLLIVSKAFTQLINYIHFFFALFEQKEIKSVNLKQCLRTLCIFETMFLIVLYIFIFFTEAIYIQGVWKIQNDFAWFCLSYYNSNKTWHFRKIAHKIPLR